MQNFGEFPSDAIVPAVITYKDVAAADADTGSQQVPLNMALPINSDPLLSTLIHTRYPCSCLACVQVVDDIPTKEDFVIVTVPTSSTVDVRKIIQRGPGGGLGEGGVVVDRVEGES